MSEARDMNEPADTIAFIGELRRAAQFYHVTERDANIARFEKAADIIERLSSAPVKDECASLRDAPSDELADMERRKDEAYLERNKVVAALASLFPSGIAKTDIPGWSPDWHGCVYIDLPAGQVTPGLGGPDREFVMYRRKEPLKGQEIGRFRVSSVDADLVDGIDWYLHDGGYWTRQPHLDEPVGYLHRVIAKRIWGAIPEGWEVDPIDRDRSNSTRSNLRLATPHGLNRTMGRGVRRRKSGQWQAYYGEPFEHLGTFDTEPEALAAVAVRRAEAMTAAHSDGHYVYPPVQCSWHYHDSHAHLFAHLPPYAKAWDGHTTEQKYQRLGMLSVMSAMAGDAEEQVRSEQSERANPSPAVIYEECAKVADEVSERYVARSIEAGLDHRAQQYAQKSIGAVAVAQAIRALGARKEQRHKNPKGRVIPCAECTTHEKCRDVIDTCGKFGEEHIYREANKE